MKNFTIYFLLIFFTINNCFSQNIGKYKKLDLKTQSGTIKISAKDVFEEEQAIPFSPTQSDSLRVPLYTNGSDMEFHLYSDIDSLIFSLSKEDVVSVDITKKGFMPFVLILKNGLDNNPLEFNATDKNTDFSIKYENNSENSYLLKLREEYPIDSIVSETNTDLEKVKKIASWVHGLWQHDGMNEPAQNDALYILNEVKKGNRFRCVEYGIVTTACLNSLGIPARTLSLKTKDAEKRPTGAGHVLLEVFLKDMNKWIMVDPQFDIIPYKEGIPLNAVEFQSAITNKENIDIWTSEQIKAEEYIPWVYPYLYYFSINFDNRENIDKSKRYTYQGKNSLMLVPVGAKNPTIFQQKYPIDYCIYTHALKDFYNRPD